jgi:hypothetical protein
MRHPLCGRCPIIISFNNWRIGDNKYVHTVRQQIRRDYPPIDRGVVHTSGLR